MTIQAKNTKVQLLRNVGTADTFAPTTSATLGARWKPSKAGRWKGCTVVIINTPALGTAANLLETLVFNKRGVTGAVGAVAVSQVTKILDQNGSFVPTLGQVIRIHAAGGSVKCVAGEHIEALWTETGTPNTVTRPQFIVTDHEYDAETDQAYDRA